MTMRAATKQKPSIGDERFVLECINTDDVLALARKQGWPGGVEGLREFCEPEDAGTYTIHATLAEAIEAGKRDLASGDSFYGCAIIDREVFEAAHDDRGNSVRCPPSWERQESYEVAVDGEVINVFR